MAVIQPNSLKIFKTAAYLGWQVESNWADPILFVIYSIIKPLASTLIIVFMYLVVIRGEPQAELFANIYLGNAFYQYVNSILLGIGWAIISDREYFQMIKYIYIIPMQSYLYLLGRGMAKFLTGTVAAIVTLLFGILVLKLPVSILNINWPIFLIILLLGILAIAFLGIILAGVCLQLPRHSFLIHEGVGGVFFLLCGVVFPLELLPSPLPSISKLIPITWWLEGIRQVLLKKPAFLPASLSHIIIILFLTTVLLLISSYYLLKILEHLAKRRGILDRTTGY